MIRLTYFSKTFWLLKFGHKEVSTVLHNAPIIVFSSKEYDIFYINAASFKTSYAEHFDTLRQAIHLLSDMLYQSSDKKVNICDGYVN